jgi:hypothetical protein
VTGPFGVWENSVLIECHDTMEVARAQVERYCLLHPKRLYAAGIVPQWFHRPDKPEDVRLEAEAYIRKCSDESS